MLIVSCDFLVSKEEKTTTTTTTTTTAGAVAATKQDQWVSEIC